MRINEQWDESYPCRVVTSVTGDVWAFSVAEFPKNYGTSRETCIFHDLASSDGKTLKINYWIETIEAIFDYYTIIINNRIGEIITTGKKKQFAVFFFVIGIISSINTSHPALNLHY